ncbi:MAG: hypothetical protein WDO73_30875 [Ignavibacteriota bacterium]
MGPALKEEGSESGAVTDAWWEAPSVWLPDCSRCWCLVSAGLVAAGPLVGAFGGLTAGVAVGGVIGILKDHGISEELAEFYAEGVKRGGALVTVHGVSEARESEAKKILDRSGAIEVEQLADEWRSSGWTGIQPRTLKAG